MPERAKLIHGPDIRSEDSPPTRLLDKAMVGDQRRPESRRYSQQSNVNLTALSEV
jgi:hypothetical protein